jgi:hypothetical protein
MRITISELLPSTRFTVPDAQSGNQNKIMYMNVHRTAHTST